MIHFNLVCFHEVFMSPDMELQSYTPVMNKVSQEKTYCHETSSNNVKDHK